MKKLILLMAVVLSFSLIAGCGNTPQKPPDKNPAPAATTQKPSAPAPAANIDIFRNEQALKDFQKDVKEKFGDDFKVLTGTFGGTVHVGGSSITFEAVDPKNTKNADSYFWQYGKGFGPTKPLKVRSFDSSKPLEDLAQYQVSFKEVNFAAIPAFVEEFEKRAKAEQLEGVSSVKSVSVKQRDNNFLFEASISASRKDISATGDAKTGKITKYNVK